MARAVQSAHIINETLRFAPGHPLETARRIFALNRGLRDAQKILQRALHSVNECMCRVEQQADQAQDAPALLSETTARWLAAAAALDEVTGRLEAVSSYLASDTSWAYAKTDTDPAPVPVPLKPSYLGRAPVVVIRRRWFVIAFSVELARKICRGRAPPFESTAISIHCS